MADKYSHNTVESEHLVAALLEQSNGLARRIVQKCGADASSVLTAVDDDLRKQPKVSGSNQEQVLGHHLEAVIGVAEQYKKEWQDEYVSVEHMMLAAVEDDHYGRDLFARFRVTKDKVQTAVKEIRGTNKVTGAAAHAAQVHRVPLASALHGCCGTSCAPCRCLCRMTCPERITARLEQCAHTATQHYRLC